MMNLISEDIESYPKAHEHKDMLRFITCGSVDDGKSTLIGRLLYDTKAIFSDQLLSAENETKKYGTTGGKLDLALLVDGLQSEREQGITIDVAYRFFNTEKRKYIIADTPGHEQYTRNMVTGASTADLAIILIDARKGVLTQTKRHSYIVKLLGIKNIVIAVNKMDLIDYSQQKFEEIKQAYQTEVLDKLCLSQGDMVPYYIPLSALEGDNVVTKSQEMPWYEGLPLLEYLDEVKVFGSQNLSKQSLRFPVQYVNRPDMSFRGFSGTVVSGKVQVGDEVTVLPSGRTTRIKSIINSSDVTETNRKPQAPEAIALQAITLVMEDEVDISRGDMIVHTDTLSRVSNSLKTMIVWMDESFLNPHQTYDFKFLTAETSGYIERINYKVNVNTYERQEAGHLGLNDIASCKVVLSRSVAVDHYNENRYTGSFIIIDRITNNTVGAGMIVDVVARESDRKGVGERDYTQAEKALNEYIRTHFPEWGCKAI